MKFTTHFALHSQATRLCESVSYAAISESQTGFSPSMIPCSKRFIPGSLLTALLQTTTRNAAWQVDFHYELFPLHSPLLGESWLVSFPPLNNMLKFGGSSYLI